MRWASESGYSTAQGAGSIAGRGVLCHKTFDFRVQGVSNAHFFAMVIGFGFAELFGLTILPSGSFRDG